MDLYLSLIHIWDTVSLLHQHGEPLVVCHIEVGVQMVVFVDGCQCDGLHAAAYIASGIHQVTAYGAVEGSTYGACLLYTSRCV